MGFEIKGAFSRRHESSNKNINRVGKIALERSTNMKLFLCGSCLLWLLVTRVQTKPQITKLFPVEELAAYHRQLSNDTKALDKFLGKIRATYNFVFRKPDNTSNVEKILAKDAPDPDGQALKSIWSAEEESSGEAEQQIFQKLKSLSTTKDDWLDEIQPVEPLSTLELQEAAEEAVDDDVETVTPLGPTLQLPTALGRHLLEWIGSLLGLTYGVYSKLVRVVHVS